MAAKAGFRRRLSAALLVGVTYVYFLLFAQFGFLQGIRIAGFGAGAIQLLLGAMAIAGVAASLLTPPAISRHGPGIPLISGLLIAATSSAVLGATLASGLRSWSVFVFVATGTGAGLGFTTVTLAADLRRMTEARHTGLVVGSGTGLAYLICNVPALYGGSPGVQAWTATIAALLGIVFVTTGRGPARPVADDGPAHVPEGWRSRRGLIAVVFAFGALVWFDSAAFAALQLSPEIHGRVWGTDTARWINGGTHAVAAVLAGMYLDRDGLRTVLALALLLLMAGAGAFREAETWGRVAGPIYACGVSLYSAALAAFAALDGRAHRAQAPAWRAAWLYAAAGWMGSAAGVGLAENFRRLPSWAAPLAALVFMLAVAESWRRRRRS